ncbi:helix-turn-helix transcriptional regulator [Longibacter salinarum]|nr:AraC family transcriptional regulator [Longibacter salinarum]
MMFVHAFPSRLDRRSPSVRRLVVRARRSDRRDRMPVADPSVAPEIVVGRAESFVDDHLGDPDLRLRRLASAADVSVSTLGRAFKTVHDTTPWQYVLQRRVDHASELLVSTDRSLAVIALDAGFFDQPHLTRTLRSFIGKTPGQIRSKRDDLDDPTISRPV